MDRDGELVAEPTEDLELEPVPARRGAVSVGEGVGDRADVVGADRDADPRPRVEQGAGQGLEVAVGGPPGREHGLGPAVLGRFDPLVIPVGALDEPDRQRRLTAIGEVEHLLGDLGRVAQVGLEDDPGRRPGPELLLGEDRAGEGERRLARIERLHVDVDVSADVPRPAEDRAEPHRRVLGRRPRSPGTDLGGQRRGLH